MIVEVKQGDVGRPLVFGECIQPLDLGRGRSVDKKAQHLVGDDGIVDPLMFLIRLNDRSTSFAT